MREKFFSESLLPFGAAKELAPRAGWSRSELFWFCGLFGSSSAEDSSNGGFSSLMPGSALTI